MTNMPSAASLTGGENVNTSMDMQLIENLLVMSTPETESLLLRSLQLLNGTITNIWNGSLFLGCFTVNVYKKHFHQKACERSSIGYQKLPKEAQPHKPDTYRSDLKRKTTYTAYSNPRGFIYQNQDKKNRLTRIDELHKFSDGTLNDVRFALDDTLKRIQMKYLPRTIWREVDRESARAMIQAIDRQLRNRRIMMSLENFVGGRLYGGDLRLLEMTI
ncbi:hypothetical protein Tco_0460912 [Tanacetum coccineum]